MTAFISSIRIDTRGSSQCGVVGAPPTSSGRGRWCRLSQASRLFSTSSRIVVKRDLPGLSKPAMAWCSAKNSAGDCRAGGRRTLAENLSLPSLGCWLHAGLDHHDSRDGELALLNLLGGHFRKALQDLLAIRLLHGALRLQGSHEFGLANR